MFSTFDYVEPATHISQRATTVTPQQSLFMMNSPLVTEQAENLARQLLREGSRDSTSLIHMVFERLYSRIPMDSELDRIQQFLAVTESEDSAALKPEERRMRAWSALCRTLISANEFVYVE